MNHYINKKVKAGLLIFFFCFFFIEFVSAQWRDTLREIFHGSVYPTAGFDSRNSFVSSRRAYIWGIKAGVEFDHKLQFGLGYNKLSSKLTRPYPFVTPSGIHDTATANLSMWYVGIYMRYAYYKTKRWKMSVMPIQIGIGTSHYKHSEGLGPIRTDKETIVVFEPGISAMYRVFKWLGAGVDFGYRLMLRTNRAIPEKFNSPIYSFYVIIYWDQVYKAVFPNSKWAKLI
jgi:hypothetical protein